jgi:acetyl-CoA carboxylase biotin carboxyl carrier protein
MNEEFIIRLLDAFSASGAAELEIQEGSLRIALRKEGAFSSHGAARNAAYTENTGTTPEAASPAGKSRSESADEAAVRLGLPGGATGTTTGGEAITSPIVATFYASPGPDSPAFVSKGSRVKKGDTLCVLEAMKMMNHLEAEFDCEIVEVKAASGDTVEFGQALFDVKRL